MLKIKVITLMSVVFFITLSGATSAPMMSENEETNGTLFYPLGHVLQQDKFLHDFKKERNLGAGSESEAFEVTHRQTGKNYALILNRWRLSDREQWPNQNEVVRELIKLQDCNPYQAKIFGHFWITNRWRYKTIRAAHNTESFDSAKEGCFLDDQYENNQDDDITLYFHQALLMELGIGDLRQKSFQSLKFDFSIQQLIKKINLSIFYDEGLELSSMDNSDQNYIFVKTIEQTYKGEPLDTYGVTHYTLGSFDLYIPIFSHSIKRIDFLPLTRIISPDKIPPHPSLEDFATFCRLPLEEFRTRFCQPPRDPTIRILHIQSGKCSAPL